MKQLIYIFLIGIIITSCDDSKNANTTKKEVPKQVSEVIKTAKSYTLDEKDVFFQHYIVKRDNTKTQIGDFKRKLLRIKKNRKQKVSVRINKLEYKQQKLEEKITELMNSSESEYPSVKRGIDSAMSELDNAIDEVGKEFN